MSRVTGLARLPGQILLSVHTVNFSPVDRDEIQRNTTKMVEHKLVSFAAVVALWTLVTLLIKLIRILLKWKYIRTRQKVCHFRRFVGKAKPFCLENLVPVTRAGWSVHMGKFSSQFPRSRSQKPRSR